MHPTLPRPVRRAALGVGLLAVAGGTGCDEPADPPPVPRPASVVIAPERDTLFGDDAIRLVIGAVDAHGDSIRPRDVPLESSDTSVAVVSRRGVVRGVRPGSATITAGKGDVVAGAHIEVIGFTALAAGPEHVCGTVSTGAAYCWGSNSGRQLGDNQTVSSPTAVRVMGPERFTSVRAAATFSCGLRADGAAYCWGYSGSRSPEPPPGPQRVAQGKTFRALVPGPGSDIACGLDTQDALSCWGPLGSQVASSIVPSGAFRAVDQNAVRGCGVDTAGHWLCWGADPRGDSTVASSPVVLSDVRQYADVAIGDDFSCALASNGAAYCVRVGQSGPDPVVVPGALRFVALDAEGGTACGVAVSGSVYCWGANDKGQLGDGTTARSAVPVRALSDARFASVTVGRAFVCARTRSGAAYCWGDNSSGQLGDGTTEQRLVPTRVLNPQ